MAVVGREQPIGLFIKNDRFVSGAFLKLTPETGFQKHSTFGEFWEGRQYTKREPF